MTVTAVVSETAGQVSDAPGLTAGEAVARLAEFANLGDRVSLAIVSDEKPERDDRESCEMRYSSVLLIIAILLLLLWGGGFAFHVAGGLIHLLLLIAIVVFILHFVRGGRSV